MYQSISENFGQQVILRWVYSVCRCSEPGSWNKNVDIKFSAHDTFLEQPSSGKVCW